MTERQRARGRPIPPPPAPPPPTYEAEIEAIEACGFTDVTIDTVGGLFRVSATDGEGNLHSSVARDLAAIVARFEVIS